MTQWGSVQTGRNVTSIPVDPGQEMSLTPHQSRIAIRLGMMAEVELHTGQKTVLQYLLKPLYKSRDAVWEP